jgi:hypothetical protein
MVASIVRCLLASRTDAEMDAMEGAGFAVCETVPVTRLVPVGSRRGSMDSDGFVE